MFKETCPGRDSDPHDLARIVMPSGVEASLDFFGGREMRSRLQTSNAQRPTLNVQRLMKKTAGGGARTHTALRPLDFESSASANSATPALSRERDDTVSAQKLKYGAICLAALPKLSLTISAKPVEVGAAYQPLILRGERS